MRSTLAIVLVVLALGVWGVSSSRSDPVEGGPPTLSLAPDEPITGDPVKPTPGDETQVKDPFEPYGIGPVEEAVPFEELSPEEQAVASKSSNLDAGQLESYRKAALQRSAEVTAVVAARTLGIDNLSTLGVVP